MARDNLLECFISHYVVTALWTSREDGDDDWLDVDAGDLAPAALERIKADCATFYSANAERIH